MLVSVLGTVALVVVAVAVGLWVDRRWSVIPRAAELDEASRPKPLGSDHEPGTAPQRPLAADPAKLARVIERQRCTCKARGALAADGEDEVRFDQHVLRVVRLRCPACGATRSLYVERAEP